MKELQGHVERLQWENDQLRAQIEKSRNLGKDVRDNGRAVHPIASNKGKEPIIPDNVDTLAYDELSSSNSPSLSLSPVKNARKTQRPNCARGLCITLPLGMLLVTHPARQGER